MKRFSRTAVETSTVLITLAISRQGTLRSAAKALGVSHSTVLRRLETLETTLGAKLFQRLPSGRHQLTAAGQEVFEVAQHLGEQINVMERRIQGRDLELSGPVQVTMPATLLPVLARDLGAFTKKYANIQLTVAAGLGYADLASTARMRAFREFLADAVVAKLDLLEGRSPIRSRPKQ